jgi:hypothetical protein
MPQFGVGMNRAGPADVHPDAFPQKNDGIQCRSYTKLLHASYQYWSR